MDITDKMISFFEFRKEAKISTHSERLVADSDMMRFIFSAIPPMENQFDFAWCLYYDEMETLMREEDCKEPKKDETIDVKECLKKALGNQETFFEELKEKQEIDIMFGYIVGLLNALHINDEVSNDELAQKIHKLMQDRQRKIDEICSALHQIKSEEAMKKYQERKPIWNTLGKIANTMDDVKCAEEKKAIQDAIDVLMKEGICFEGSFFA